MVTSVLNATHRAASSGPIDLPGLLQDISRELEGLRHGQVVIKIHDGRAVAIERVSRLRRDQHSVPSSTPSSPAP